MTQILIDDPCILFALHRESAPFCDHFSPNLPFAGAPCRARFCGPVSNSVLVLETGVGQANVATALDWLLSMPKLDGVAYRPSVMLFAGFAGALHEALQVGDVVLANEVIDLHGNAWRTTWPNLLPETLPYGRLLTADRMIASPTEKRQLGVLHDAVAVEMESALFAARCAQADIPFGCVRAISDDVTTSLSPELTSLLSGGGVSPWRVLAQVARTPRIVPELWRLGRDTKRAAAQLGLTLAELLQTDGR